MRPVFRALDRSLLAGSRPAGSRQARLAAWAALLALPALQGCAEDATGGLELPPGTPVVLVVIDTLRADHLSCYGYELPTSPVLDEFARSAILFEHNSTQFNSTFPSLTSILTGLYPKTHGNYFAVPIEGTTSKSEDAACLAERFRQRGYETLAVLSHPSWEEIDRDIALMRGWDEFSHIGDPIPTLERPLWAHERYTNERLFEMLERRGVGQQSSPLFLWAHYFDPHTDLEPTVYNAPEETRNLFLAQHLEAVGRADLESTLAPLEPLERTHWIRANLGQGTQVDLANGRALYDAEIRSCDAGVGRLFDRLRELGLYERALIVVMADHGENMEDPGLGHGPINFTHNNLYESVTHTPLIIKLPAMGPGDGRRVSALSQNIDLTPTLVQLLDLPVNPAVEGRSLVPLLEGSAQAVHERVFIESSKGGEKAVRTSRVKFVDRGEEQHPLVFDLEEDPDEARSRHAELESGRWAELAEAIADFRPLHALRVRFEPDAEPYDASLVVELPDERFHGAAGVPAECLSDDGKRFEWSGRIAAERLDVYLVLKARHPDVRVAVARSGLDDLRQAVRIGDALAAETPAVPIFRAQPAVVLDTGGGLADAELKRFMLEFAQAGKRLVWTAILKPSERLELQLRYPLPTYDTDFEVLRREGVEDLEALRGKTVRFWSTPRARLATVELGVSQQAAEILVLPRFDGRWPSAADVAVNGSPARLTPLEFAIPRPPDGELTRILGSFPGQAPAGSISFWMESRSPSDVVDMSHLDPELVQMLRSIGYADGEEGAQESGGGE